MTNSPVLRPRFSQLAVVAACAMALSPAAQSAGSTIDQSTPRTTAAVNGPSQMVLGRAEPERWRHRLRPGFFGMGMENYPPTWPDLDVGAARITVGWAAVEHSAGKYTWTGMDARVATAASHNARPLLVVLGTPSFHARGTEPITLASPPRLGAFQNFIRALVHRYGNSVDYQVWNEPNVPLFYTGSPAQMARMTRIVGRTVRTLAPKANVVAPSFPLRIKSNRTWFRDYWMQRVRGAHVGNFVDVASLSAYPMPNGDPEDGLRITDWAKRTVARAGYEGPMWVTEINYGANSGAPTDPIPMRRQVSNVVRTYVLHAIAGTRRVFWYSWIPDVTVNSQLQDGSGALTKAGDAYGVVQRWLIGTRPGRCGTARGVTTCSFRVGADLVRSVSWSASGRIRTMPAPSGALSLSNIAGVSTSVRPGQPLRVGVRPVMIEARRAS